MIDLLPSILVKSERAFHSRLKLMNGVAPIIHIEVLDNTIFPSTSWADPEVIKTIGTHCNFEIHLMVQHPEKEVTRWLELSNVVRLIWHVEAPDDHAKIVHDCQHHARKPGLAINPKTPKTALDPFASILDEILVMGVEPGASGQHLLMDTVKKAREIRERFPKTALGFDGGVNDTSIPFLKDAGITRFCSASAIFESEDPVKAFEKLRSM